MDDSFTDSDIKLTQMTKAEVRTYLQVMPHKII